MEAPGKGFRGQHGTAAAGGSILAFLDDDVEAEPGWLGAIVERFRQEPALSLLTGRVIGVEGGTSTATTRASEETRLDPDRSLQAWPSDATSPSAVT
jgi:hypothetical protein